MVSKNFINRTGFAKYFGITRALLKDTGTYFSPALIPRELFYSMVSMAYGLPHVE